MISLYSILLSTSGLSQREAAEFHNVRIDTVKSWCGGRNNAPKGVVQELKLLIRRQRRAADELVAVIVNSGQKSVEIGIASDDLEAKSPPLGWPCVAAQTRSIGMAAAMVDVDVKIVPRGATLTSAAAIEQHE